jgi:hypothetical protein
MAAIEEAATRSTDEASARIVGTALSELADLAFQDLELRRAALNRLLDSAIGEQALRVRDAERTFSSTACMRQDDAERLLGELISLPAEQPALCALIAFTSEEEHRHATLRRQASQLGARLPLDRLAEELELGDFELDVIVLCVVAEMDRGYGRLFAFIVDNMNRQAPSIELLCMLGTRDMRERLARRRALGPHARLRRCGLISVAENSERPLHATVTLASAVIRRLTQPGPWSDRFFDPDRVTDLPALLDAFADGEALAVLATGLRTATIDVCGIWGKREHGVGDAVIALADEVGRPLFRLPVVPADMDAALGAAEDRHAMVWVRVDELAESPHSESLRALVTERLVRSTLPMCLSGEFPWRPTKLLAERSYAELRMRDGRSVQQKRLWRESFHELDDTQAQDVAARFHLSPGEINAVARVVRTRLKLGHQGSSTFAQCLDESCALVTQRHGMRFTQLVEPRRGPSDLVLPDCLHRQVLEVARFYRTLLRVDVEWGFGRIATGGGGIKVLFTGESGTGKTLAAEVIAGQLGLGLMKVDLSRMVSKWVGETEKNLECAFREAEDSHAVLFLDEADTLCGKRGEIQSGSDRYANLEVGYLLQRLEQYSGLAVLATNLKDEMDQAFVRRFQLVLHFPRPGEPERRRLWQLCMPTAAPLDPRIDLELLVKLDMTGASIAGAARMAALLAADESSEHISERHLREGIRRQYQQEARLLNEEALKPQTRIQKHCR